MQRKSFDEMPCPIARSLERVGEWGSILILRDAFRGLTRFEEFQKNLGIAPNMLTRRLSSLVEAGMLERRRYNDRPPRYEYVLTERGRDFRSVLGTLMALATAISHRRSEHHDRRRRDRRAGGAGAGRSPLGPSPRGTGLRPGARSAANAATVEQLANRKADGPTRQDKGFDA